MRLRSALIDELVNFQCLQNIAPPTQPLEYSTVAGDNEMVQACARLEALLDDRSWPPKKALLQSALL